MKTSLLFSALAFLSLSVPAQKQATQLQLNKGQQIIVNTSTSMDMDMGMGMNMKNDMKQKNTLVVTEVTDNSYTVSNTLDRMQMSGNMAGSETNFDSDKKEDMDGEIGKAMQDKIGKAVISTIDRKTAAVTVQKGGAAVVDEEINPMGGMMAGGQMSQEDNVSTAIFIIPAGKKPGDNWVDSSTVEKMKTVNKYEYKSITGNLATILVNTTLDGTNSMEAQGMQMDVTISSKSKGEILVDTKTSLVQKRSAIAEITGNIDMMGQSMPISSTATTLAEYKY